MKKITLSLTLSFLFTLSFQLYSQNWQTVKLHQNNFYKCTPSQYGPWNMNAIRIDSAYSAGNDSVFLNFNTIRDTAVYTMPGCVNIHGASWLGSHVTVDSLGINTFFNSNEDSIKLKTHSQLNDSWRLYNFANGNYLEATLSSVSVQLVSGIPDSVKQITLQCKDSSGNAVAHLFNGKDLLISKQYGIIKLYDFYNFPNDTLSFNLSVSHLMTFGEVYDYNVGDEFGFVENCSGATPVTTLTTVLGKHFSSSLDTVYYHLEVQTSTFVPVMLPIPHLVYTNTTDTTIHKGYTNLSQLICTTMPMENGLIDSATMSYNPAQYMMDNGDPAIYCGLESYTFLPGPYFYTSNCPTYYTFEENDWVMRAIQGCGMWQVRRVDNTALVPVDCYGDLNYIHKGSFICGTPPDMTVGINNLITENEISIYPNPFSTQTTITSTSYEIVSIKIMDIIGTVILQSTINGKQSTIDLSDVAKGIYFVQITLSGSETGSVVNRKIVVE